MHDELAEAVDQAGEQVGLRGGLRDRQAGRIVGGAGAAEVDRARSGERADAHRRVVGHVQAAAGIDQEARAGISRAGADRDRPAGDLERLEGEADVRGPDALGVDEELTASPLGDPALQVELEAGGVVGVGEVERAPLVRVDRGLRPMVRPLSRSVASVRPARRVHDDDAVVDRDRITLERVGILDGEQADREAAVRRVEVDRRRAVRG